MSLAQALNCIQSVLKWFRIKSKAKRVLLTHNPSHTGFSATHAAISIDRSREEIFSIAKEQGWRAIELSRGGFSVIEFWIENKIKSKPQTPRV